MKAKLICTGMVIVAALLFPACSTGQGESPSTTASVLTLTATPPPTATLPVDPVSVEDVSEILWQLHNVAERNPPAEIAITDPDRYSLTFMDDGVFRFTADCNTGEGGYAVSGDSLALEVGSLTLAECDPDSLSDEYLAWIRQVERFGMREGMLVLDLAAGGGEMQFQYAGIPQPTPTPTPEPPACEAGIDPESVSIDTFDLPVAYQARCMPGTPYDDREPTAPRGIPDHIQVAFEGTGAGEGSPGVPAIYIIPVEAYSALWKAAGDPGVRENVAKLEQIIAGESEPPPSTGVPILPYEQVGGVADLFVQGKFLEIGQGHGLRFVSRFPQGPSPVTRDDPSLFYTFQGMSADGRYLVAFFYPVTTGKLPGSDEVSDAERTEADSNPDAYLEEKTAELNKLAASDWEPDLRILDGAISSLQFEWAEQPGEGEPGPTPLPPAEIIFTDDFDSQRGWYTGESDSASFKYTAGTYQITNKVLFANIWSVRSLTRTDVGQQVELQQVGEFSDGFYGVACRFGDDGRSYYALMIGSIGSFGIGLMEGGKFQLLSVGVDDRGVIERGAGAVNTLRGDCIGETMTLYVNGHKLLEVEDGTIESGEVGLINRTGSRPEQTVRYDNYSVFRP
jgi:heat shock protein HslJ